MFGLFHRGGKIKVEYTLSSVYGDTIYGGTSWTNSSEINDGDTGSADYSLAVGGTANVIGSHTDITTAQIPDSAVVTDILFRVQGQLVSAGDFARWKEGRPLVSGSPSGNTKGPHGTNIDDNGTCGRTLGFNGAPVSYWGLASSSPSVLRTNFGFSAVYDRPGGTVTRTLSICQHSMDFTYYVYEQ